MAMPREAPTSSRHFQPLQSMTARLLPKAVVLLWLLYLCLTDVL